MTIYANIFDAAATIASLAVTAAVPILLTKGLALFHITMDAQHRDALQTALTNASSYVLADIKAKGDVALADSATPTAAMSAAINAVKQSVPDAVAHFGISEDTIAKKITEKAVASLIAPAAVTVVGPTTTAVLGA